MKRYLYIRTTRLARRAGLWLAGACILVSCLGESPRDQLDENDIYSMESGIYVNAVASLYNYIGGSQESEGLQGTCRGIYDYNTLTTDEAIIPIRSGDWYDGGLWNVMYQHKWTAADEPLYDTWKYLFKVIVLCNKSLDVIESHSSLLTEAQKMSYEAEVRAVSVPCSTIMRWTCMDESPLSFPTMSAMTAVPM